MKIFNIKNMGDLVPNYPDHWMVAVEHQPEFKYIGKQIPKQTQAWLWYHMEPSLHMETLVDYLWEKWGVTDHDEALKYVDQWNYTVKHGASEVEFEAVFGVGYGKMGVLTDPEDPSLCQLFGYYPVSIPYHHYSGAGRGGYAWQRLLKKPLQDDLVTHHMLAEKFALWKKQGRTNLIKMYNRMLEE